LSIIHLPQITHGCAVKELYNIRTPVIFDNTPDNTPFFEKNNDNVIVTRIEKIESFETRMTSTVMIMNVTLLQEREEIEFIIKADREFIEELITSKRLAVIHTSLASIEGEITIGCEIDELPIQQIKDTWHMITRSKANKV
jgi:hypothetical protein